MNGRNCSQFSRAWYPIVQKRGLRQCWSGFWSVLLNRQSVSEIGAVSPSMTGCSCCAIAAISNLTAVAGNVFQFPAGWTYYYTSRTTSSDARSLINSRKMTGDCSAESIRCGRNTVLKTLERKTYCRWALRLPLARTFLFMSESMSPVQWHREPLKQRKTIRDLWK